MHRIKLIMRSGALCGAVSVEALSSADFARRALRIIPDGRSRGACSAAAQQARSGSCMSDDCVAAFELEERAAVTKHHAAEAADGDASSNNEAIRASGALNRPRRSSGGSTASTASSFSVASIRK